MATKVTYKTTFEPEHVLRPIYTGGSVALDQSGRILATTLGEDALLTDINTGRQLARIEGDGELISTLTLTPSASHVIICSRSLSMRIYALKALQSSATDITFELVRTLKPHPTPVIVLAVDSTSTLLATGAADGVVKVWDIRGGYVTHTFRGPNVLVSALHFFELVAGQRSDESGSSSRNRKKKRPENDEDESKMDEVTRGFRLASGSQDGKVRIWDLYKSTSAAVLDSHVSDVRALDYSPEENTLLTASRDKTIMWWDVKTWKVMKVVPILEEVEVAGFIGIGKFTYTGGANGTIRVWQTENGREVTNAQSPKGEAEAIVGAVYHRDLSFVLSVQADHTLILHSTTPLRAMNNSDDTSALPQTRRISGTHDEIIDLGYLLPDHSLLALATNSEEIRIVSLTEPSELTATTNYFGSDVAQLKGHDDIIICLAIDWSGHWIATGAKDNTARLWRVDPANSSFTCYATFTGHAESLGAVSLPQLKPAESSAACNSPFDHPPAFLLTGSQDQTVKRWDIPNVQSQKRKAPRALYTRKAHEKDINAIDINYDAKLFASASQDKTVKIWSVEEGEGVGVLRGHRRGVWSVKFAPKGTPTLVGDNGPAGGRGLVLTGSGDKTVKIWSLSDYTCLRTFEGHTNSVLKVGWLNLPTPEDRGKRHLQIVSAGGDGLVKVWDATNGEVDCTLDNHEDRVWALAVHPTTNMIISGGGDSTVTFWKDTTEATAAASTAAATQFVEQEQELQNHIRAGSYRSAITLALQLNHPARLLSLFTTVVTSLPEPGSLSGSLAVDEVLSSLSDDQLFLLLLRLRDWNTNNRNSTVAQKILFVILKSYPASKLSNLKVKQARGEKSLKEVVDALRAYTERHYKRMEELLDESWILRYTLMEMDGLGEVEGDGEMKDVDNEEVKDDVIMME